MSGSMHQGVSAGDLVTGGGALPAEWGIGALRDQLLVPPKYGIGAAAVPLVGALPVYLRITDISDDGYFAPTQMVGVDKSGYQDYFLSDGELVFARTGASVGRCYLYRTDDGPLVYAGFLIKISPDSNKLKPSFLFQYTKTKSYWDYVRVMSMRSGQPGMNGLEYGAMPVPLPPPKEQTAIANALSDVDALIISLEKLIAKKRAIKTAAMQQLLTGKKRLPPFDKADCGYQQTELGEIPSDWEVVELGDRCASFKTGKLDANASNPDGEYRFYTCAKNYSRIDSYAFETEALLVSGNGANVGYVHYYKGRFNAYQRTYVLSDFSANVGYLKLYLERKLSERIRVEVNSGNTPYITMDTLTDMAILIPPSTDEQAAIANALMSFDSEIGSLQRRLTKTKNLKQGMMQELLTGRTRLL